VRRLGEVAGLAGDGVRRLRHAEGVETSAREGRGAGANTALARRCFETDAVSGASGDDQERAGARDGAAAVAELLTALDRV